MVMVCVEWTGIMMVYMGTIQMRTDSVMGIFVKIQTGMENAIQEIMLMLNLVVTTFVTARNLISIQTIIILLRDRNLLPM